MSCEPSPVGMWSGGLRGSYCVPGGLLGGEKSERGVRVVCVVALID